MTRSIPEQAVEAAALTLYALRPETNMGEPIRWRDLADHLAALYRSRARAALTAAAPLLGTVGREIADACIVPMTPEQITASTEGFGTIVPPQAYWDMGQRASRVAILSLRPALPAPAGWQPIETAPKDGTEVLLWSEAWEETWGIQKAFFNAGLWVCGEGSIAEDATEASFDDDEEPLAVGPTHWCALPAAPAPAEPKEG